MFSFILDKNLEMELMAHRIDMFIRKCQFSVHYSTSSNNQHMRIPALYPQTYLALSAFFILANLMGMELYLIVFWGFFNNFYF